MSTGFGANCADIITKENLIKVVKSKKLIDKFMTKFDCYNFAPHDSGDYDELAQTLSGENPGDIDTKRACYLELKALWDELSVKFKMVTGINLYIDYHDVKGRGDCYDQVNGLYFNFYHTELYQPTKAYKAMIEKFGKDIVEQAFFVHWG